MNADPRAVLDAAIHGHANSIVTQNLRDFPAHALDPWSIQAVHPSDFLVALHSRNAEAVVARMVEIARKRGRTPAQRLTALSRSVPAFARHVAAAAGWNLPSVP